MTSYVPALPVANKRRRMAAVVTAVLTLSMIAAPSALAAPPEHAMTVSTPIEFPAGDVCDDAVRFENTTLRGKDTVFAPAPSGRQRIVSRGSGVSLVTNLETGATYEFRGGVQITFTFAADGSLRADAHGSDFIAWYYEGDQSDLDPGLYQVSGHLTEWYDPQGALTGATYSGRVTNLCEAVGA